MGLSQGFFFMREILDLFGEPVPDGWGGRGRPAHVASQQNRNRVSMLVALGWSNKRIAAALFVTLPTLRKHYFSELKFREVARDRLDATLATKLWDLFLAGNVAAGKEFRKLVERNDLMLYGQSAPPDTRPAKAPKLGKKEQALVDARQPDTGTTMGELIAMRQGAGGGGSLN
jgi:hypothetical protein